MTVLKLSGCSQPWREWKRVRRFVFRQFNQWLFPNICPRFVNPIFYSLANFVLWVCVGVASMKREAPASVSFQKNRSRTLHFFSHQYYGWTLTGNINFHASLIQSFQNLQVVKRQQVDEFARRLIFPIIQAVVAVSENSSSLTNFFKCHNTHFQSYRWLT